MLTNAGRLIVTGILLFFAVLVLPLNAEPLAPFEIAIENHPAARVGDNIELSVNYLSGSETFGKFKFIIAFDPEQLRLVDVKPGVIPTFCNWDSFSYGITLCGGCLLQTVEINGWADDPNVPGAPSCFSPTGDLARIRLQVLPDTLLAGTRANVAFYWMDCTSNTMESAAQDTVWHGRFAYDYQANEITGTDPNLGGTLAGCIVPGVTVPIRAINTQNGGVQISTSYGIYGDVNGDNRFNISDILYMINYMFADGSAPKDYLHGEYDGDGRVTIGDVVFLMNYLFLLLQGHE